MGFHRRNFLKTVVIGAGVAAALPYLKASAKTVTKSHGQVPGLYRTRVGQSTFVTTVFDGGMEFNPEIILTDDKTELEKLKKAAFYPKGDKIPAFLNGFLVENAGKTTLIDTGAANYGSGTGHIFDNLAALGVKPGQIDQVILTHAHPDHVNGLISDSGQPIFKVPVYISEEELNFWFDDAKMAAMPGNKGAFDAARKALSPYKASGQLQTFKMGADMGGGLSSVALPGHTPGHSGVRVTDGHDQLLIWGDIVHLQSMQFRHPDWALKFDIDPAQAIATRKGIMEEVATDKTRIAGMHLSLPGMGHVAKASQGYDFIPQYWEAEL